MAKYVKNVVTYFVAEWHTLNKKIENNSLLSFTLSIMPEKKSLRPSSENRLRFCRALSVPSEYNPRKHNGKTNAESDGKCIRQ